MLAGASGPLCCGKPQHVRGGLSLWHGAQGIRDGRASPGVLSGHLDLYSHTCRQTLSVQRLLPVPPYSMLTKVLVADYGQPRNQSGSFLGLLQRSDRPIRAVNPANGACTLLSYVAQVSSKLGFYAVLLSEFFYIPHGALGQAPVLTVGVSLLRSWASLMRQGCSASTSSWRKRPRLACASSSRWSTCGRTSGGCSGGWTRCAAVIP